MRLPLCAFLRCLLNLLSLTLPPFIDALRRDHFFHALLVALVLLSLLAPAARPAYVDLVDWTTIATLGGLLLLTKGLELSGYLERLGGRLVALLPDERALAYFLVAATAVLAMFLTNDVALFVIVPLTLGLRATVALPIVRLVVFEALAANAGSAFTPIGNPQNLFLWQFSGVGFGAYCLAMLPLLLMAGVPLALLCRFAFPAVKLEVHPESGAGQIDTTLLALALGLYLPFLVLADAHHGVAALVVLLALFALLARRALFHTDWGLILVFVLMFVDLRLLAMLPQVRQLAADFGMQDARNLYVAGLAASQVISNVPAAILLAETSRDWRTIAFAVNLGGFGFIMGSLANIIALRMIPGRGAFGVFHAYSIPFLLLVAALGYGYLFWAST